jgi:hypothetical protein
MEGVKGGGKKWWVGTKMEKIVIKINFNEKNLERM